MRENVLRLEKLYNLNYSILLIQLIGRKRIRTLSTGPVSEPYIEAYSSPELLTYNPFEKSYNALKQGEKTINGRLAGSAFSILSVLKFRTQPSFKMILSRFVF